MRSFAFAAIVAVACSSNRTPSMVPQAAVAVADRKLNGPEQKLVEKQGFAIIEQAETQSFHVGYTALFKQHQPVYVTADSVLYAWHSSYDKILQDVEMDHLIPALRTMLASSRVAWRIARRTRRRARMSTCT